MYTNIATTGGEEEEEQWHNKTANVSKDTDPQNCQMILFDWAPYLHDELQGDTMGSSNTRHSVQAADKQQNASWHQGQWK